MWAYFLPDSSKGSWERWKNQFSFSRFSPCSTPGTQQKESTRRSKATLLDPSRDLQPPKNKGLGPSTRRDRGDLELKSRPRATNNMKKIRGTVLPPPPRSLAPLKPQTPSNINSISNKLPDNKHHKRLKFVSRTNVLTHTSITRGHTTKYLLNTHLSLGQGQPNQTKGQPTLNSPEIMAPLTDISRTFGQQQSPEPISRTMQYRKVTKPLLERQRRARINRCLDELKDILINGLQAEGENVARLEKADILELTVRHLHKLQTQQQVAEMEMEIEVQANRPIGDDERFRAGYEKCAQEVSRALAQSATIDIQVGTSLMIHLGTALNQISSCGSRNSSPPPSPKVTVITRPKVSPSESTDGYRPYTPPSSPQESGIYPYTFHQGDKMPWRPW